MKYWISIPQAGIVDAGLLEKTDLVDWCLIDFFRSWANVSWVERKIIDDREYVRINFSEVLQMLPIVKIGTKKSLSLRMKKLKELELVRVWYDRDGTVFVRVECGDVYFHGIAKSVPKNEAKTDPIIHNEKQDDEINEVVQIWNDFAKRYGLPVVAKVTEKRLRAIKNRLKEDGFDLLRILEKIKQSDFLLGRRTDWRVDFDFVFCSKNNYVKILEGKYDNKSGIKTMSSLIEWLGKEKKHCIFECKNNCATG